MVIDKEMVERKRKGKIAVVSGEKQDKFTEKYELLDDKFLAVEEIEYGEPCTLERIAKIRQGRLILLDLPPSPERNTELNRFNDAITKCNIRKEIADNIEGCPVGYERDKNGKCKKIRNAGY